MITIPYLDCQWPCCTAIYLLPSGKFSGCDIDQYRYTKINNVRFEFGSIHITKTLKVFFCSPKTVLSTNFIAVTVQEQHGGCSIYIIIF